MKWMKGYLAGLLTALLVCGLVVTAGAKSGKVTQELTYRDIRVSLDGKVLDLRNAIGEKVEPFMFDGTNYLPVRALAEALGLNVAWNGAEVMVVLTTPEPPAQEPAPTPVTADKRSGNLGKYHVEIKGARLAKSYDGKDALVVTFEWTNNSDETRSAMVSIMESAFQNGIELDRAIVRGTKSDSMKEIRPGATLEIEASFELTSLTAPIEVEVEEWLGMTEEMVTATFNPAELQSAS